MDEFSKHEVYHTASIVADMWGNHIVDHPAVQANPRWLHLAEEIQESISDFYQETAASTVLRDMLKDIIKQKSFRKGKFVLASGVESDYFFDLKPTMLDPAGIDLISGFILDELGLLGIVDAVGGVAMGGIPLVSSVCMKSLNSSKNNIRPMKAFYVRPRKDHGTEQVLEGGKELQPQMFCVCLEDVTTTGKSIMEAVKIARGLGCYVDDVVTVIDRLEGARENLMMEGITLHSIFTREDFE